MKEKFLSLKPLNKYKVILFITFGLIFLLLSIYFYGFITYSDETFGRVYVNGVCVKNDSSTTAVNKIKKEINSTSIQLIYENGDTDTIRYKQAGGKINKDKLVKSINQLNETTNEDNNRALWFIKSFQKKEYTINFVEFNEDRLIDYMNSFDNFKELTQTSHNISRLSYKKNKWSITTSDAKYNPNLIIDKVENAFQMNKKSLNIQDCLIDYDIDILKEKQTLANEYCNATVEYKNEIAITPQLLLSWIQINADNEPEMNDDILRSNIKTFLIENVASEYSTKGIERNIKLSSGKTETIKGGTFGDKVDISAETEKVLSLIKKHRTKRRSPEMTGDEENIDEAKANKNDGIGDTFIEVDLEKGKLYYLKNGSVYFTTDIITGGKEYDDFNTSTPTGIYTVTKKNKNYSVSQLLNSKGNYLYINKVNYYLNILNIPGKKIGISDTTDKDKTTVTEETPITEDKTFYYVKTPSGDEIKAESEDEAKQIIQTNVDNDVALWQTEELERRKSEASDNSQDNSNQQSQNSQTNQTIQITDEELQEKRKEIERSYSYESRTETVTSATETTVVKEIDKTKTYGNIEMSTDNMTKLYDLIETGIPVVIH